MATPQRRVAAEAVRDRFRFNFDPLFPGAQGPLSQIRDLQPAARRGGKGLTAAEVAGQLPVSLTGGEKQTLSQFFNPQLTGQQNTQLEAMAKRAAAQGLMGNAVFRPLLEQRDQFVAESRADSFGGVQSLLQREAGKASSAAAGFVQGLGEVSMSNGMQLLGLTQEDKLRFARSGLGALGGLGLGDDAVAELAQAKGIRIEGPTQADRPGLGGAFATLLSPRLSQAQQRVVNQAFTRRRPGLTAGLKASARAGAADTLSGAITGELGKLAAGVAELGALGNVGSLFRQTRDPGLGRQIASADFSGIGGLLRGLGIQQGTARLPGGSDFLRVFGQNGR